jgi:hypothetical protein
MINSGDEDGEEDEVGDEDGDEDGEEDGEEEDERHVLLLEMGNCRRKIGERWFPESSLP